jgi:hypothetical protein
MKARPKRMLEFAKTKDNTALILTHSAQTWQNHK